MMICVNAFYKAKTLYRPYLIGFAKMFACVCPFAGEEIYEKLGFTELIDYAKWPTYDAKALVQDEVTVAVSVNGKVRSTMLVSKDTSEEELQKLALGLEAVQKHIEGKTIRKIIVVKGKIVNIVVG